jgi:hypothetical protein
MPLSGYREHVDSFKRPKREACAKRPRKLLKILQKSS